MINFLPLSVKPPTEEIYDLAARKGPTPKVSHRDRYKKKLDSAIVHHLPSRKRSARKKVPRRYNLMKFILFAPDDPSVVGESTACLIGKTPPGAIREGPEVAHRSIDIGVQLRINQLSSVRLRSGKRMPYSYFWQRWS